MVKIKFSFLVLLFAVQAHTQITNIIGPAGSGQFGKTVTVLTNGNFVVTDPIYDEGATADVGAVYLYDGITYSLISTLKGSTANDSVGSHGITALNNGNYLVHSPSWNNGAATDAGAITWCNGTTGVSGVVSSSNSLVGSNTNDNVGGPYAVANLITILNNGNYLVRSPNWNNKAGAVTWANGTTGISGVISSSNSLVGSTANDLEVAGITVLNNGNYIVTSKYWDNGTLINAGAVTWGNGATGISGVVSSSNSLVGSSADDHIGSNGVKVLNNDNYVVISNIWDNGEVINAGAVTWGNGTTGISGVVSSSNSLVGTTTDNVVGGEVVALSNGNYVVISSGWDNGSANNAGAVTWGSGTTGISGAVSSSNSLVGTTVDNRVGSGGISVLNNGNYVVISPYWDNGSVSDAGAVTWANGTTGISGAVSSSNSLVGSNNGGDKVGGADWPTDGGVVALSNGNYVVISPDWNNSSGAVTWGNGTTGISGVVSSSNSLVGSYHTGGDGVIELNNGNYVVTSPEWSNGALSRAGAVTWANGTTGISGVISSSNSLTGIKGSDLVGRDGTVSLSNGNYVVSSSYWDNGAIMNVGAVTWANGTTGITGNISSSNSLIGSKSQDNVGNEGSVSLSNGNYVVSSTRWANGTVVNAGAVTWGNGTTGVTGVVSSSNSLVGSTTGDRVGGPYPTRITELSNGNYMVISSNWNNGAGAVTWGNGTTGVTGVVNSSNSLVGSNGMADSIGKGSLIVLSNNNYLVSSPLWGNSAGAVSWGNGSTGTSGVVSRSNSLVGSKANDKVGQVFIEPGNNYVVSSPTWDNGTVPDAGVMTWGNSTNGVAGNITSCNSIIGGKSYDYNNIYNYLIAGRPSENIVSIFSPVDMTLAGTLDTISTNIYGLVTTPLIASGGCRIIASLILYSGLPVNGTVNAKVWIEDTVPVYNGFPFVARHYEITPVTNAYAATGRITLYFTQQEFNDFNDNSLSTLDLPTGSGDATGKSNLRIWKFPGTSSDGSGLPATYTGTWVLTNPNDNDIVWNSSQNRWEVSFDVFGFSGFIVFTNAPGLPLTLLEFNGRLINNNGVLNWETADEVNTLSFDIERSTDGRNYSTVGNVTAVNQPGNHLYNYTDYNIISLGVPVVYYRLKLKDMDGRFMYSKIIALSMDNSKTIVLFYPNPVNHEANLIITVNEPCQLQGRIIDNTGRVVKQLQWNVVAGSSTLPVDVSRLSNGLYFLELKGKKINESIRFVKL